MSSLRDAVQAGVAYSDRGGVANATVGKSNHAVGEVTPRQAGSKARNGAGLNAWHVTCLVPVFRTGVAAKLLHRSVATDCRQMALDPCIKRRRAGIAWPMQHAFTVLREALRPRKRALFLMGASGCPGV